MLSTKTIENKIITKLKDLSVDGKKEVLEYIESIKIKRKEKLLNC